MVSLYQTDDLREVLNEALAVEKVLQKKISKLKTQKNNKVKLNSNAKLFQKVIWKIVKKNINSTKKISNKKQRKIQQLEQLKIELFTKTGLATDTDYSIQHILELQNTVLKIKDKLEIDN